MNILLANHRYFISGGPERYLFAVSRLLESNGHKVVPFAMKFAKNQETAFNRYFAAPPVSEEQVFFSDQPLTNRQKLSMLAKTIYNYDAARMIKQAIKTESIELVYTLQVVNFLYASTIMRASKMGLPVVARFSDFQLLCPAYTFFRDGHICEECKYGLLASVRNRCLQNSASVSLARVIAMNCYKLMRLEQKIDVIIAPSRFLMDKLVEYGIAPEKIMHIPTYLEADNYTPCYDSDPYVLYVGNIQKYKGVDVLVQAFSRMERKVALKIVGRSNDGEDNRLQQFIREQGLSNVEFLGFKDGQELRKLYQKAMFLVMPSRWYENMPNVMLEAMAYGKPVVGSRLGSITELINDQVDGLCFEAGDVTDLAEKMRYLIDNKSLLPEMGRLAREKVEQKYNPALHYQKLNEAFQRAACHKGKNK